MSIPDFADLPFISQSERVPADPLAATAGRYAALAVGDDDMRHPNDKRKKPEHFSHIVLPPGEFNEAD